MKAEHKPMLVALTTFLLLLNVVAFLGLSSLRRPGRAPGAARVAQGCRVEILSPQPGETVGRTGVVEGTATIPEGARLWVVGRRRGALRWRAQGDGPARLEGGRWSMRVEYGAEGQRGLEFHLAAAVLAGPSASFPDTVPGCALKLVAVRRGE